MKQDGEAGTPRLSQGPREEAPPFQFSNETQAFEYVLGRGRTKDQVTALVAAAQMGMAISKVMGPLRKAMWIVQERGPAAKPDEPKLSGECTFVRAPPKELPASLNSAVSFAGFAIEVVDATRQLVSLAKSLRATLEQNPALAENITPWTSELQMTTAFTLHAADALALTPPLGYREMEAVALLVGYRDPEAEFLDTERQEDNWRKLVGKVRAELLPALRVLTPPSNLSPAVP